MSQKMGTSQRNMNKLINCGIPILICKAIFLKNTTTNNLDKICMIYVQSSNIFSDLLKYGVIQSSILALVTKAIFKKIYCPTRDVLLRQFFISIEMTIK